MKTFDIEIKNLGPIKSGHFEAAHLNVICGPNNSGKSFFLHSIYVFLRKGLRQYFEVPVDQKWVDSVRSTGVVEIPLQPLRSKINDYLAAGIPEFVKSLPKFLAKQQTLFKDFQVHLKINPEYVTAMNNGEVSLRFQLTEKCNCDFQKTDDNLKLTFINSEGDFPDESLIRSAIELVVKFVLLHFIFAAPVFLVTSERTGSSMFVDSIFLPSDRNRQDEKFSLLPASGMDVPLPHHDELKFVSSNNLRVISKDDSIFSNTPEFTLIRKLLRELVSGTFSVDDAKGVRFTPEATNLDLDISEVSSSIRALMPLDFIIRHCLNENSILLFDEPELNLTPENQRRLARLLVQLTKAGVGVFITTHSDYIVREINTLIAFQKKSAHTKQVAKKFGYMENEHISPEDVALYYIKQPQQMNAIDDNVFERIHLNGDFSIGIPPFDDSIREMADIQTELSWED